MKKAIILTILAITTLSANAFADVKIKSKQTMSGQSSENTTLIKGKRSRTEMMNGLLVSITQCDLARDLQLNPQTKTYVVNQFDDGTGSDPQQVDAKGSVPATKGGTLFITTTIKDTGERKQMFGYTARHIVQTVVMESSADACNAANMKTEMDMWVIDDQFGLNCQQNRQYVPRPQGKTGGCTDKIVPKTIGTGKTGYPLWQKMTMFDASGKETMSMIQEVVELSKATLDQRLFEAPADYREVKDSTELYAAAVSALSPSGGGSSSGNSLDPYGSTPSPLSSSVKTAAAPQPETPTATTLSAKKPGTVRIGVAVKTTSVGEGITANDLSAAIQNTIGQFLKGTKVEVVPLEARLAAAQAGEAKEKECDFVLTATAAHKKGGGGFGFGKLVSAVAPVLPMGGVGGMVASQVLTTAVITASSVAGNVKSKDELSLDLKLTSTTDNSVALAKQLKTKAKADGDDIISALVEQAAQAILDSVSKG